MKYAWNTIHFRVYITLDMLYLFIYLFIHGLQTYNHRKHSISIPKTREIHETSILPLVQDLSWAIVRQNKKPK